MQHSLILFLLTIMTSVVLAETESPYQGQENRNIKALSQSEIDNYLLGKGRGYAKAAELNHYPGPRHVLDLAKQLALTPAQNRQSQAIFDAMQAQAITLGKQLIEKEKQLDKQFADSFINADSLNLLVSEIGELEAKIRYTHLAAHLKQTALLSKHQIQQYNQLRGYQGNQKHHQAKHH